jgi:hypothetical protein
MIQRFSRFARLWGTRRQSLDDLAAVDTLEGALEWSARHTLLGFDTSALRLRILYSLAAIFRPSEFIETGTYHGATAICARNALHIPVRSCEVSLSNSLVAKLVTLGLSDIRLSHRPTEEWLPIEVERQRTLRAARPFFYLDAHSAGVETWPLGAEVERIVTLESFLAAIDDFSVPENDGANHSGWIGPLSPGMIRNCLTASGIHEIYVPAYPASREKGFGRAGFAVFFRSPELASALQRKEFPYDLLERYPLG